MISQRYTFDVSEAAVATQRRAMMFFISFLIFLVLWIVAAEGFDLSAIAYTALFLLFLFLAFHARYSLQKWRQMKLHLRPECIARETYRTWQEVSWDKITRIRIYQDSRGISQVVEIFTGLKSPLLLAGFELMPEIVKIIETGLPATAHVEVKKAKLGRRLGAAVSLLTAIVMVVGVSLGIIFMERWGWKGDVLFPAIGGVLSIVGSRFISRFNQDSSRDLLIGGILLLSLSLGTLLLG
jgi:hypothetical protein